MKTRICMLLCLVLLFCLAGCGNSVAGNGQESTVQKPEVQTEQPTESNEESSETENPEERETVSETEQEANVGGKVLVAYFSATGTTKPLAEYAAEILSADLYEIVAEDPYTEADLAYYTNGRADQEQNDPSARPEISGSVENMEDYDTIILGYPIWHGQAPRIISTFLESYDFSGKTILLFCTSHSSGVGSSADNLHELCPDSVNWLDGKRFEGGTTREGIESWLESMHIE